LDLASGTTGKPEMGQLVTLNTAPINQTTWYRIPDDRNLGVKIIFQLSESCLLLFCKF
jgi:hypothetical protein